MPTSRGTGRALAGAVFVVTAIAAIAGVGQSAAAGARERRAIAAEGLKLVATVPYENGTHLVTATIKRHDYVFAANANAGPNGLPAELRVIDVTKPERPKVVALIHCGSYQGHLQLSSDQKTLILGVDRDAGVGACIPEGKQGFITIDVTNPSKPKPIGYAVTPAGSHSTAAHPTKPLVYNAPEGSPVPDRTPADLEVWSIANPAKPKLVNTVAMPGVHSPHDISFNEDGTMAATANISSFNLLDTSDPTNPVIELTSQCPGCQHTHEARFTPDGKTLVVNDESLSTVYPCPGGALYFYDLTGERGAREATLAGTYSPGDVGVTNSGDAGFCTAHVFDISANGKRLAASWHSAGIRYLDISGHDGVTRGADSAPGGTGVTELGSYTSPGGDSFTAKFLRGPYIYSVDIPTGLQIFRITGD
jgi:hypothetical protein